MKSEFATEAIKGTPAVGGAFYAAFTLNEVVAMLTAAYVVLQAAYLLRKWWREEKELREKEKRGG